MASPNPILPDVRTVGVFEAVRRDETVLAPGVRAICARHGLDPASADRFPDGSLPVYAVGERLVLKLYPPLYAAERDTESTVLQCVDGKLSIPTPAVEISDTIDGWCYLLMTRLHGEPLVAAWPNLAPGERIRLAGQLGEALAALHAIRDPRLERVRPDWTAFLSAQRVSAVDRQRARGLHDGWLEQIPEFLDAVEPGGDPPDSLLHTEVMREHLLVERTGEGCRLSGLFDFEPAMVGAPAYEFASVGLFVSAGDAAVLRTLLLAYGMGEESLDAPLAERFLAMALLHRYSDVPWFLTRVPPPPSVKTLRELAACWWGT